MSGMRDELHSLVEECPETEVESLLGFVRDYVMTPEDERRHRMLVRLVKGDPDGAAARTQEMRARSAEMIAATRGHYWLRFQGVSIGRFPLEPWMSVHVWSYEITESGHADPELLQGLIDADLFAYSYIAPIPDPEWGGVRVHGPYLVHLLSAASFRQTTAAKVTRSVEQFLASGQSLHSLEELSLAAALPMPLPAAVVAYELDAPDSALDRQGGLMPPMPIGGFSDFVVIHREGRTLKEIVTSID